MLETIKALFATSPFIAWSIVATLVGVVFITIMWDRVKWWAVNTWMSFPVIGKIASLSKQGTRSTVDPSWYQSEITLCGKYKEFIQIQDENDFNEKIAYLTKAGDNGRTPMPGWIWVLTALLVFVEALGFSYVMAGWTIQNSSETTQQYGAIGIAFIIAVILVAFTHWSGEELYRSSKIKHARRLRTDSNHSGDFETMDVSVATKQSVDDDQPRYTQLANRVGPHASYLVSSITLVLVLVVAIGATYVRGQILEKVLHNESTGASLAMEQDAALNNDSMDMSAETLVVPDADVAENQSAKSKELQDQIAIDRHGGWGTFFMLAFIFAFLQILGVIFGYRWGFAGKESDKAFKSIGSGRFSSYADVRAWYNKIADTAQTKLSELQQKMKFRNSESGSTAMQTKNTFRKYMELQRLAETEDLENEREHDKRQQAPAAIYQPAPVSVTVSVTTPDSTAPFAPANQLPIQSNQKITADEAVAHLNSFGADKEAKLTYLESLPEQFRTEVTNALKANKQKAASSEKRAKLAEDLDGLL